MTKAEKVGVFFSAAALIISIISPIATYLWLDPNLKAFKDRARLQVHSEEVGGKKTFEQGVYFYEKVPDSHKVTILNVGKLPARDIQIVTQFEGNTPTSDFFTLTPPLQFEIHRESHECFVTLKRPLSPQDSVEVAFTTIPSIITVSTDSGETSTISSPYDSTRYTIYDEHGVYISGNKPTNTNKRRVTRRH